MANVVRRRRQGPMGFNLAQGRAAARVAYRLGRAARNAYMRYSGRGTGTSSATGYASKVARKARRRLFKSTPSAANPKGRISRAVAPKGVYRGSIKYLKKGKTGNKFAKYGFQYIQEHNALIEDSHCVYAGHGTSTVLAYRSMWGAAFRTLMHKGGIDFVHWFDTFTTVNPTFTEIRIYYSQNQGSPESVLTIPIQGPITYDQILSDIVAQVAAVENANSNQFTIWRRIRYVEDTSAQLSGPHAAVLDLTYFHVQINIWSKMKIQNRTLARKDIENDGFDEDSADNIEANPLTGKIYEQMEWMNGFNYRNPRQTAFFRNHLGANIRGLIAGTSDDMDVNGPTNPFRKPPPAYFMGTKIRQKTVKLDPGSIKDTSFVFNAKGLFNTLAHKLEQHGLFNGKLQPIGKAQIFALEKELTIGVDDNTGIRLGVQIDQKYNCVGYYRTPCANPITDIPY